MLSDHQADAERAAVAGREATIRSVGIAGPDVGGQRAPGCIQQGVWQSCKLRLEMVQLTSKAMRIPPVFIDELLTCMCAAVLMYEGKYYRTADDGVQENVEYPQVRPDLILIVELCLC